MKKIINYTAKSLLLILAIYSIIRVSPENINKKISNENMNKTLDLTAMAEKFNEIKLEDLYYPLDTFTGELTGYAANCPLCNGHLGCTGQNVLNGTTIYKDKDYGNVAIVASSKNLPCGSIVTFKNKKETKTAIVLDRGVSGTDLDLLVENEDYARKNVGRKKITYNVLRFGWKREAM